MLPHQQTFPYRPHLLAVILAAGIAAAACDPAAPRADRFTDVVAILYAAVLGYILARLLVRLVRPLIARWPRQALRWGLIWFYGVVPLALAALLAGTARMRQSQPNAATIAFVCVAAAATAAGAHAGIRAAQARLSGTAAAK